MTLPYNIVNGQAIDATPVMANFNSLDGRLPASNVVAAAAGANSDITSLTGLTTALAVSEGGTGGNTQASARSGIGAAASGANSDITSLTGLTTALAVSEGGTGDTGTQWSTQTVTPTAGAGTLTSASAVWRFKVIGKTAFFNCVCTITTNGTGASSINIPLPTGWTAKATSAWGGQGAAVSGKAFSARVTSGGSSAILLQYDATYPASNGEVLAFNGVLELT